MMARQPMQDVVPPERRSIRDVTLPNRVRMDRGVERNIKHDEPPTEHGLENGGYRKTFPPLSKRVAEPEENRKGRSKLIFWIVALIAVLFLVATILMVFAKATVYVIPRTANATVQADILADQSGDQASLPFEIITLGRTSSVDMEATGEEFKSEKAFGTITIYNNYSKAAQRLIKNTRFESPAGKIYRIDTSVTVPGQTEEDGVLSPGKVDIVVYADEAGPSYNIESANFTIPGFKNDANRYEGFYAKTKTPIEGGFLGSVPTVDETDLQTKYIEMESRLRNALLEDITAALPPGYMIFPRTVLLSTTSLPTTPLDNSKARVELEARATAYVFPERELGRLIAELAVPDYDGLPVEIQNPEDLSVEITRLPTDDNPTLTLSVTGNAVIQWLYDKEALVNALVGQPVKSAGTIVSRFSGLEEEADVSLQPFFKRSFPASPTRIEVVEQP